MKFAGLDMFFFHAIVIAAVGVPSSFRRLARALDSRAEEKAAVSEAAAAAQAEAERLRILAESDNRPLVDDRLGNLSYTSRQYTKRFYSPYGN